MEYLSISRNDKILIIAPHPDDECIGPGGVVLRYSEQCSIIVLTSGDKGQGDILPDELREIRKKEFIDEMNFLGIKEYCCLEYPDGQLFNHLNALLPFDLKQYTKIFVTHMNDNHPDHTAAFQCLIHAVEKQNVKGVEIFTYEIHNSLNNPAYMLDITEEIRMKQELVRFHKSQLRHTKYDEFVYVQGKYRALQNGMNEKFLEVFGKISSEKGMHGSNDAIQLAQKLQKQEVFYSLLTKWLELNVEKIDMTHYFVKENLKNIVIYGYAELGKILSKTLMHANLNIMYILDKKEIREKNKAIQFLKPTCLYEQPDIVIVTAISAYEEIKNELLELGYNNVLSLSEIVNKIYEEKLLH